METFRCPACGKGTVRLTRGEGRTAPHLNIPDLPVPADLVLMTCDNCGEGWDSPEEGQKLREAMASVYAQALAGKTHDTLAALKAAGLHFRDLERVIALSPGYLSRLESGKEPSAATVSLLALLAADPRRIEELRTFWHIRKPRRRSGAKRAPREASARVRQQRRRQR